MNRRQTEQLYRLLLLLLLPPLSLIALYLAIRDRSWRSLSNRFARALHAEADDNKPVWIHCASVGETNTAMPLIKLWLQAHPEHRIIVTTTTASAARLLRRRALPRVRHYYLPLDYPGFHKRFIRAIRPRCLLVMETEIWLGMFSQCHRHGVAVIILNARLSQRTLRARAWLGAYFRASLAYVRLLLARSQADAEAYRQLGLAAEKIELAGNLKHASSLGRTAKRPLRRDYFLAASTHAGEDEDVAETFLANCPHELLVIAPRYPKRARALCRKLKKRGLKAQLRSQACEPANDTTIYIVDTLGELGSFICHAQWVFMGGSLRNHGGHNLLEPAAYGVAQVTGPDTSNFAEEAATLVDLQGLVQVKDLQGLASFMRSYRRDRQARHQGAERARRWVRQQSAIARRYYRRISETGCLSA